MNITPQQLQIASTIHDKVIKIYSDLETDEAINDAVLEILPDHLQDFGHILDSLESEEFPNLCQKFPGFMRFVEMMKKLADAVHDGVLSDNLSIAS
jgi:hypothetical protein